MMRLTIKRSAAICNTRSHGAVACTIPLLNSSSNTFVDAVTGSDNTRSVFAASSRSFATGSRGSRGYGWFYHYRQGNGGRHLQGEYYDRDTMQECMAWNQSIIDLGSQRIYMDIIAEPRRNAIATTSEAAGRISDDTSEEATASESESTEQASTTATTVQTTTTSSSSTNPNKYFNIPPVKSLTGEKHRILIDIASTVLPATCDNFINLIQMKNYFGNYDNDTSNNQKRGYSGSRLYRIEKNVGIYGGDVLTNTGRTGMAYNAVALTVDVSKTDPIPMWHIPGTITMIVPKVNEIDSRFLLCTQHAPHIDGICRPFGMMTTESIETLQNWQTNLLTMGGGIPNAFDLYIAKCGIIPSSVVSSGGGGGDKKPNTHYQPHEQQQTISVEATMQ